MCTFLTPCRLCTHCFHTAFLQAQRERGRESKREGGRQRKLIVLIFMHCDVCAVEPLHVHQHQWYAVLGEIPNGSFSVASFSAPRYSVPNNTLVVCCVVLITNPLHNMFLTFL